MNSSNTDDEPAPDPRLRDGLRSLPLPETPALEARVRRRLRRKRIQRAALNLGVAIAIVVVFFTWRPWTEVQRPPPVVQQPQPAPPVPQTAQAAPREIPTDELAVLFAPPPVDSLGVLDRQDKRLVAALNRLEDAK